MKDLEDSILAEAKLKNLVSNSGFKTPEGYLDNFTVSSIKKKQKLSLFSQEKYANGVKHRCSISFIL